MRDGNGNTFRRFSVGDDTTDTETFTTDSAGRYYVVLTDDCAGDPYQVRAGPPDALTQDPSVVGAGLIANPVKLPEPNQSLS